MPTATSGPGELSTESAFRMRMRSRARFLRPVASVALLAAVVPGGCANQAGTHDASGLEKPLSPMAAVGKQIFEDKALSVSGEQSCATCHVAANAFSAGDGRPVPLGGPRMDLSGLRNTPSIRYAAFTPRFHFEKDGTPVGGFFRDGRVDTLADQATLPFVTSFEMANGSSAEVRGRLQSRPYAADFEALFGAAITGDPDATLKAMGQALAAYETEDDDFHPFTSKFDAYESGQASLDPDELHGLQIFNDPTKGNCTACHTSSGNSGVKALFTDFTYDNVGIPRNWAIPANQAAGLDYVPQNGAGLGAPDYGYYDLGLCGPLRRGISTTLCGAFKVPTLRNVAVKQRYFHNGVFDSLNDAVTWYVTRDKQPARWYHLPDSTTPDVPYNDLPVRYDANVNVAEVPYNPILSPTLDAEEIRRLVAFLCTLTDGYDPQSPQSYSYPSQCPQAAAAAGGTH
jgi:cytochrome c peroxidase